MMVGYAKTAIVFDGSVKEALLYFDHIVPVTLVLDLIRPLLEGDRRLGLPLGLLELVQPLLRGDSLALPPGSVESILPLDLREDPQFRSKLATVNITFYYFFRKLQIEKFGLPPKIDDLSVGDCASIEKVLVKEFLSFADDFGLKTLPLDCPDNLFSEEDVDQSEIVISLPSLHLVDASGCSWEQILEFRRDEEARDKLRRLRLFAYDNYSGKSKDYVEDDILKRIADYDEAVKQWGFETTQSALNMLLTSKIMGGALTGSLFSTLFGAPAIAAAAAVGGGVLEIGRIALDVTKQRFALRRLIRENPVSYISHVKSKLELKA